MNDIKKMLEGVRDGTVSVEEAVLELKKSPFEDIGCAKVDMHRRLRQGASEVIYGAGKTAEQIAAIVKSMLGRGQETILITRLSKSTADVIALEYDLDYHPEAGIGIIGKMSEPKGIGKIVVAT